MAHSTNISLGLEQHLNWFVSAQLTDFDLLGMDKGKLVFSRFFDIRGNLGNVKKNLLFPPVHWMKNSDYSSLE